MLRHRVAPTLALLLFLALPMAAGALSLDYAALPTQSAGSIVQTVGGVTITAEAFGGAADPQALLTPTGAGGLSPLSVNVGGSATLGTRGLACGPAGSQCDLIAPAGEDALRITFSQPVTLDQVTLAAMEDPDDVSWWAWDGTGYSLAGQDTCETLSFCGGNESYAGPFGPASSSWLFVAEETGASAFAVRGFEFTVQSVPEPAAGVLFALGGAALTRAGRRRRASLA